MSFCLNQYRRNRSIYRNTEQYTRPLKLGTAPANHEGRVCTKYGVTSIDYNPTILSLKLRCVQFKSISERKELDWIESKPQNLDRPAGPAVYSIIMDEDFLPSMV